ncbi:TolB family protein [Thermodesulfovibrio hydrogeniphilus]
MKNWDWQTREKLICDISKIKNEYPLIHELLVSNDGEKIAAVVEIEDKQVKPFINGQHWENSFERVCFPQFTSENSFICLVLQNYEWTLAKDDSVIDGTFDYAWNLQSLGSSIAFNVKKGDSYGVFLNGKVWENLFFDVRDLFISPDGQRTASYVKVKNPPLLDIFSAKEGIWTIAVDGIAWQKSFISVYGCCFSPDSKKVASTVRLSQQEFTVAVDDVLWNEIFLNAWEPIFINENDVAAPVKTEKGWTVALNGKQIWNNFTQILHLKSSPTEKLVGVVATEFGKWTIAVDGIAWERTFSQAVLPPFFSNDGKKVAAVVRENNQWTVAVDGIPWNTGFDRIWSPQFSPDGQYIVAKVEKDGAYFIAIDGTISKENYEMLWEPHISPDGEKILVRCIKEGKYLRKIMKISEVLG